MNLGQAADRRADPGFAGDRGKLGGVEASDLGKRRRRKGIADEVLEMRRQVAQLTRFIDQTGLLLADFPVTNKLHFPSLPRVFSVAWMLHGTARGEIQLLTGWRIAAPLILGSGGASNRREFWQDGSSGAF